MKISRLRKRKYLKMLKSAVDDLCREVDSLVSGVGYKNTEIEGERAFSHCVDFARDGIARWVRVLTKGGFKVYYTTAHDLMTKIYTRPADLELMYEYIEREWEQTARFIERFSLERRWKRKKKSSS